VPEAEASDTKGKIMKQVLLCFALLALTTTFSNAHAQDEKYFGVPQKPDPPPAIDGRLDEWNGVPNAININTKEQAVYGGSAWKSPADLSARVWLAWRADTLYFAADVTDDRHEQRSQGTGMWQGDHVTLYLDLAPDLEPARLRQGAGQIQFGFSPGSLQITGDPINDKQPEATVFHPQGASANGVLVAAQKTAHGYALEAAMPWKVLMQLSGQNIASAAAGLPIGFEAGISDTDVAEPKQEKMMTVRADKWEPGVRTRLVKAVLAPTDGVAPPVMRGVKIFENAELAPNAAQEFRFSAPPLPAGKEAVLMLRARLEFAKVAGYNSALKISLNGVALDGTRLTNRAAAATMNSGQDQSSFGSGKFTVPYAPAFEAADKDAHYGFRDSDASALELRVSDLLKSGENVLQLQNLPAADLQYQLVAGEAQLQFRTPQKPRVRKSAPTGTLPVFQPQTKHQVAYKLSNATQAAPTLTWGKNKWVLTSQFSTPDGKWVQSTCKYFQHTRRTETRPEAILVFDTFTNLTDENLPLMQQHRLTSGDKLKKVWLAGLSPSGTSGTSSKPDNPTSYGTTASGGLGVMALDDITQVHVTNFTGENLVGLADNQLVLKPGATHTAEWAILPTQSPDYYAFLNAARRLRDCNFSLDGSFAFLRADPRQVTDKWTDQQFLDFIRFKNANLLCDLYTWPNYKGLFPHGTAFQTLDWTYLQKQIARLKKIAPDVKHLTYFHCFIEVLQDAAKKYADARLLRPDGSQADYGNPSDKIFVPTTGNDFGRDIAKNLDIILGDGPQDLNCDGVYWDEFAYSSTQYHYDDFSNPKSGLPWDGVSADINPATMKITRLKSSVPLLSQDYRMGLVKRILAQGPLVANGMPFTRTMVKMKFPRFVETGSISNCATAQIFSPIALGDHLTERSEADAYRWMLRALDYGCLYYWYNDLTVIPAYPTLTSYMFPITPLELHPGFIIGKERIITKVSGAFGWGDKSKHEVHVFDEIGREVKNFKAKTIVKNGQTFTELRLAEDWSAAIIRKQK
jgi:hypothetical protein